jgi:hypothetical protein
MSRPFCHTGRDWDRPALVPEVGAVCSKVDGFSFFADG